MKYIMQVQTTTASLAWEYSFESNSDRMAVEYAAGHTKAFANVPWFMAMAVWAEPRTARERCLGTIKILPAQVRVAMARPFITVAEGAEQ